MPSERVLSLEKQKTDFHRSYKEKKLPPEFYQETSALPDEEAMELDCPCQAGSPLQTDHRT